MKMISVSFMGWLLACAAALGGEGDAPVPNAPASAETSGAHQKGFHGDFTLPAIDLDEEWIRHGEGLVKWSVTAGYGTAPVLVRDGKIYGFGAFLKGIAEEEYFTPASIPSRHVVEAGDGYGSGEDKVKLAIPGQPQGYFEGSEPDVFAPMDEYVYCLAEATGKPLWKTRISEWGVASHCNASYPMAVPLYADGRLFVHSPEGRVYALDAADGRLLWERNLFEYGMLSWYFKHANACAPVLAGGLVVVQYTGGRDDDYAKWSPATMVCAAFDPETGEVRWWRNYREGGFRAQNAQLKAARFGGREMVLASQGVGTFAIDPADGGLLWKYGHPLTDRYAFSNPGAGIPFPYPGHSVVVDGEFVVDEVSSAHDDDPSQTWCFRVVDGKPEPVWATHDAVHYAEVTKGNMVARDGWLYLVDARGLWPKEDVPHGRGPRPDGVGALQCVELATGRARWTSDALFPPGKANRDEFKATYLFLAGDYLFAANMWQLTVGRVADGGLDVLRTVPLGESARYGVLTGELTVADGTLYVRTCFESERVRAALGAAPGTLFAIRLRPPADAAP